MNESWHRWTGCVAYEHVIPHMNEVYLKSTQSTPGCPCVCACVSLSICQSVCLSVYSLAFVCVFVCVCVYTEEYDKNANLVHIFICNMRVFVREWDRVWLFVCTYGSIMRVCVCVFVSVRVSVGVSVCVCWPVCVFMCLCLLIYLSGYVCVCASMSQSI